MYKNQLDQPDSTALKYPFDPYFDRQLQDLDKTTGGAATREPPRVEDVDKNAVEEDGDTGGPPPPPISAPAPTQSSVLELIRSKSQPSPLDGDSAASTPIQSPGTSRPTTPIPGHLVTGKAGPGGRGSRRARKAANITSGVSPLASGDESKAPKDTKGKTKKGRKWTADGLAEEDDGVSLDYSAQIDEDQVPRNGESVNIETAPQESWGSKTKSGQFVLKDLDDEINSILKEDAVKTSGSAGNLGTTKSAFGSITGYFQSFVGGKTLTKEDLEKPLKAMEDHLIKKNVAREASLRICEEVEREMLGKNTAVFEGVDKALRPALETALRRILTPKSSLDLLQEIEAHREQSSRPFVFSIIGTNGTGKSTNLSKIAYFLLQNNLSVLIAAVSTHPPPTPLPPRSTILRKSPHTNPCQGDTFRSGAVEQLSVHVRNLKELSARESLSQIDLYQKGYGKDAASIARDAVAYAERPTSGDPYAVVLIDTAGRAHTNTTLMSSLSKFVTLAQPDKIIMVGEALAGSDLLGQAHDFSRALGVGRTLDGFLISKVDTVDANVGALVSVVHATGIPVLLVGTGQHYQDIRNFSVGWAVGMLLKD